MYSYDELKEFKFSELQAIAILEMKLQKLAGLERKNIELELKEKQELIKIVIIFSVILKSTMTYPIKQKILLC
jgi:DNA gyrase/topoisomerase IV subunit A